MRSRFSVCLLVTYLMFALFACSKPAGTSSADVSASGPVASGSGDQQAAPVPENAQPVVISAGTTLTVRLTQAVGSKISQPGQSFSATLARAVVVDGEQLIPAGATASGTVIDAQPLGRFKGRALLELRLTSVNIGGSDFPIETSALIRTKKGKGKRTAVLAGGGAGLGALIGGLAGGGKGAAIGALVGGGAGTAGAAYTGNDEIVLPAESALSFKLRQEIQLQ